MLSQDTYAHIVWSKQYTHTHTNTWTTQPNWFTCTNFLQMCLFNISHCSRHWVECYTIISSKFSIYSIKQSCVTHCVNPLHINGAIIWLVFTCTLFHYVRVICFGRIWTVGVLLCPYSLQIHPRTHTLKCKQQQKTDSFVAPTLIHPIRIIHRNYFSPSHHRLNPPNLYPPLVPPHSPPNLDQRISKVIFVLPISSCVSCLGWRIKKFTCSSMVL